MPLGGILSTFFPRHSRDARIGQRDSAEIGLGNEVIMKNP